MQDKTYNAQDLTVHFTQNGFLVREEKSGAQAESFAKNAHKELYALGFQKDLADMSASFSFLHLLAKRFASALLKDGDLPLSKSVQPLSESITRELLACVPFALGSEYLTAEWLGIQWGALSAVFIEELAQSGGDVSAYLREKSGLTVAGRVYFHLVEYKDECFPFAFLATYSTVQEGKVVHLPLKHALSEYKEDTKTLLGLLHTVGSVGDGSEFIASLTQSGELFSPLHFTSEEAYLFLKEVPFYESCGVMCRIPNWWGTRRGVRVQVTVGEKTPAKLGADTLLSFEASVSLGEVTLTQEEVRLLLSESDGLAFLKGKWVEVDRKKLSEALAALEGMDTSSGLTLAEAMRLELGLQSAMESSGEVPLSVNHGTFLKDLWGKLQGAGTQEKIFPGAGFNARLRGYQERGLNWLSQLCAYGFGALLADDMGLGKTVQVLAFLEYLRQKNGICALLIIPTLEEPVSLSELARHLNQSLQAQGCGKVSAVKISSWLVAKGYLHVVPVDATHTRKEPTQSGFAAGITTEERQARGQTFLVNLYPPVLQRFITEQLAEILSAV